MSKRTDKFEYWRASDGDWWWRFRASNGQIIAGSTEGYKNEAHCLQMIGRIRGGSPEATIMKVEAPK